MRSLVVCLALAACGRVEVRGDTEHDVTLKMDLFGECFALEDQAQQDKCVNAVLKLMEILANRKESQNDDQAGTSEAGH